MKARMPIVSASLVLFALIQVGGWAQSKYVPRENEEIFGRWKDEKVPTMQTVIDSVGFKVYYGETNTVELNEATLDMEKKWTDADGNVWYKTLGVFVGESPYAGTKFQALYKVFKSKTELECWVNTVNGYDPKNYPAESAPTGTNEYSYFRVEQ